jgi:hypothetical protein
MIQWKKSGSEKSESQKDATEDGFGLHHTLRGIKTKMGLKRPKTP